MSRRFTEEEVALVLKRAVELQAHDSGGGDLRSMSLPEMEAAGAEAGIDQALVRKAARELRRPRPSAKRSAFLGGPTHIRIERVIEGEVPVDLHEELVEEIRTQLGEVGAISTLGRSLTWTSGAAAGMNTSARLVNVTVTPRGGRTTLRVEEKLNALMGNVFGGIFGGVGGGGVVLPMLVPMALGFPGAMALTLPLWFGGVFGITRRVYAKKSQQREEQALGLMERMLDICEKAIDERAPDE